MSLSTNQPSQGGGFVAGSRSEQKDGVSPDGGDPWKSGQVSHSFVRDFIHLSFLPSIHPPKRYFPSAWCLTHGARAL